MGNKGKNVIFALAGVYLAYLGGSLILQSYREKPDQYVLFMVAGIGFIVFGLVILAGYLKVFFKHEEIKEEGEETSEDESTDDVETEMIPAEDSEIEELSSEEQDTEAVDVTTEDIVQPVEELISDNENEEISDEKKED